MRKELTEKRPKGDFLYLKIYQDILSKIEHGTLTAGEKIATEQELQLQYQVSRDTIRKALLKLAQEGYLTRKASAGTFVKTPKANYPLVRMESFSEMVQDRGLVPSSEILSIEIIKNPSATITANLDLHSGDRVYKISRIRKADELVMALEYAYIPESICPNLHTHILEDSSLFDIYENQYGLILGEASMELEAELPTAEVQSILKIKSYEPILKMLCLMHLTDNRPLYYVVCYYIGSKYVFTTKLSR
jgi:GntR family transcriptional regulator